MNKTDRVIIQLVRKALNTDADIDLSLFQNVTWDDVINVSVDHGVAAIAFDGVEYLPAECRPDMDNLMDWLGQTEYQSTIYEEHRKGLALLGAFYAKHEMPMMLLKGYGLSLNYPKPEHRPSGDIDSYMFGRWKEADELMTLELGIKIDESHHHHTVFRFEGQSVENHYDFINVHSHLGNKKIEGMFKDLARVPGKEILPNIYEPTPLLNLLFVARHAALHFASGELIVKQIVDWGTLVRGVNGQQSTDSSTLWPVFWNTAKAMGMLHFVMALSDICICNLGFDRELFHMPQMDSYSSDLADRIIEDTFHPDYGGERPKGYLRYSEWIIRRWFAHTWKHKIVYNDSLVSTFIHQALSHLKKPSTLRG